MWFFWKKDNMKKFLVVLLVIVCFGQSACERDDLCAETTPTTPLLVIDFFDADNPADEKIPENLAVLEDGETDLNNIRVFNATTISIPLRTDDDQTVYQFLLNSTADADSAEQPNNDLLTFTYERSEEFVSKACGFRITYSNLNAQSQGGDDADWIQSIETINPILVNDTITHVRIFH